MTYKVEFIQLSAAEKRTTNGTVKVEGTTVKSVPNPDQIDWSQEPGVLSGTTPGKSGQQNVVVADFHGSGAQQKQTVKRTRAR